jgi:hypothetical protein
MDLKLVNIYKAHNNINYQRYIKFKLKILLMKKKMSLNLILYLKTETLIKLLLKKTNNKK